MKLSSQSRPGSRAYSIIARLVCGVCILFNAHALEFRVDSITAPAGTVVTVPVRVSGFSSMSTVQFSMQWDTAALSFSSLGTSFGLPNLASGLFSQNLVSQGKLALAWDDGDGNPKSVSDGTVAFEINFTVNGSVGSSSTISFGDSPTVREASMNLELIPFNGVSGTITVGAPPKQDPVITWPTPPSIGYGTQLSSSQLNATASVPGVFSYTPSLGTLPGAGNITLSVTFDPTDTSAYNSVTRTVQLTVNRAPLTVTADAKSRLVSQPNPALTVSYSGFVNGETQSSLTLLPILTTAADSTSPAGSYPIIFSQVPTSANYAITAVAGTLTITAPQVTVGFSMENHQVPSGSTIQVPVKVTGFSGVDSLQFSISWNPAVLEYMSASSSLLPGFSVGNVGETQIASGRLGVTWDTENTSGFTASDGSALLVLQFKAIGLEGTTSTLEFGNNPTPQEVSVGLNVGIFSGSNGNVQVTAKLKQDVVITWNPPSSIIYGTTLNSVQLNATASAPGTFAYDPPLGTRLNVSSVGQPHTLRATFTPTDPTSFNPGQVEKTLVVNPAPLTISADNKERFVGDPNPEFTFQITGFVFGESTANLVVLPSLTSSAGLVSPAGNYSINFSSSASSPNYTITQIPGVLSVVARPRTNPVLSWSAPSPIDYGNPLGAAQLNATANVAGSFLYSPTIGTRLAAGTHKLTAHFTPADSILYNSVTMDVNLTVNKRGLIIQADNKTREFGEANPPLTLSFTGFIEGEGSQVLATQPVLSTPANSGSAPGSHPILFSQEATAANYLISHRTGTLTVNLRTPNTSWQPIGEFRYGLSLNSGHLNATADAPGNWTYAPQLDTAMQVGSMTVVATFTPSDPLTYKPVTISITREVAKASLTITADSKRRPAGKPNPELTFSITGFVLGETLSSLGIQPVLTTTAQSGSPEGSYPITFLTRGSSSNYSITHVDSTLLVTAALPKITFKADNAQPGATTTLNLPIRVAGFRNVSSFQFSLSWNPNVLSFQGVNGFGLSGLSSGNFGLAETAQGRLGVSWDDPTSQALTLADDSIAFQIQFIASANVGSSTSLTFGSQPTPLEVAVLLEAADFDAVNGAISVGPKPKLDPTLDWQTPSAIQYGARLTSVQLAATANTPGEFRYEPALTTLLPAGDHLLRVDFTPSDSGAFNAVSKTVTLRVNPAPLIITADNKSRTTKEGNPELTLTFSGFVNGESSRNLEVEPLLTTTASSISPVGTYPISFSREARAANYSITHIQGNLTIQQAPKVDVVVTWPNPGNIVYGTPLSSAQLNASASAPGTFTYSIVLGSILPAGNHSIVASFSPTDPTSFNAASLSRTIEVRPSQLRVVADNKTRPFGEANPSLTVSYSGFVNGENESVISSLPQLSTSASVSSPQGNYAIVFQTVAVSSNYSIESIPGILSITAPLPVISFETPSIVPPAGTSFNVPVRVRSFQNVTTFQFSLNWDVSVISFQSVGAFGIAGLTSAGFGLEELRSGRIGVSWDDPDGSGRTLPDGTTLFEIQFFAAGATGTRSSLNFGSLPTPQEITVNLSAAKLSGSNATIVIGEKPKTDPVITWASPSAITYGVPVSSVQLNATANVPGTFEYNLNSGAVLNAGVHTLVASFTPNDPTSFNSATKEVILTVNKTLLTIQADNKIKTAGESNPALTLTYKGFVNNESETQLLRKPQLTTTAAIASSAGSYPITFSTEALSENYSIQHLTGSMVVNPVPKKDVTLTWKQPAPIAYGARLSAVELSAVADVPGNFLYNPPVGTRLNAGVHELVVQFTPNDSQAFNPSSLKVSISVTRANLTVAAENKSRFTTEPNPALTVSYTGFVNNETVEVLTTTPALTTTASSSSKAGVFPITFSREAVSPNYNMVHQNGTLTITDPPKTDPVLTWNDPAPVVYGAALGEVQLNAKASVAGEFIYNPKIGTVLPAGTATLEVAFSPSDASKFNSVKKTVQLQVNKALLTVSAENKIKTAGATNPNLTISYSGFVNAETESVLVPKPVLSTSATVASTPGNYPIVFSTKAEAANYQITHVDGTLVINTPAKRDPIITWTFGNSITYGVALSKTELSATANTAGEFKYSPDIGSILAVGVHTLNVTFQPSDSATFNSASKSISLTVTQKELLITANNLIKHQGQANPTLTVTYSGFVNNESSSALSQLPVLTTTATVSSSPGNYPITFATLGLAKNYSIKHQAGEMKVNGLPELVIAREGNVAAGALFTLDFTVRDDSTTASLLSVVASVSGVPLKTTPTITQLPNTSGTGRRLTFTADVTPGLANIELVAKDADGAESRAVLVVRVTGSPTIQIIEPLGSTTLSTPEDTPFPRISFVVSDTETKSENLRVNVTSNNTNAQRPDGSLASPQDLLISGAGIVLLKNPGAGAGAYTLDVKPSSSMYGSASLVITVADEHENLTSRVLTLGVTSVNDTPVFNNVLGLNSATGSAPEVLFAFDSDGTVIPKSLSFVVSDADHPVSQLRLSFAANDSGLFPPSSFVAADSNTGIILQPARDRSGDSIITARVTDPSGAFAETTFVAKVPKSLNSPPVLTGLLASRLGQEDKPLTIAFSIADRESATGLLAVSVRSSNTSILPPEGIKADPQVAGAGQRQFVLQPAENKFGKVKLLVEVTDPDGGIASQEIEVDFQPVNDAPSLTAIRNQELIQDSVSSEVSFEISDVDTPLDELKLAYFSSNPLLLPFPPSPNGSGLIFGGADSRRTFRISPTPGITGSSEVRLLLSDGLTEIEERFTVTVVAKANTAPSLEAVQPQLVDEDSSIGPLQILVVDKEHVKELKLVASSSNPTLLPNSNIKLEFASAGVSPGTAIWRFSAKPAPDQHGRTRITIQANDPLGLTGEVSFDLEVAPINDPPLLTFASSVSIPENGKSELLGIKISDVDSPLDRIGLEISSSNLSLIPVNRITLSGLGTDRFMEIIPVTDQSGTARLTLTARGPNGGLSRASIEVIVLPAVNRPPVLSNLPLTLSLEEDAGLTTVPFAVTDPDSKSESLILEAVSSNPELVASLGIEFAGVGEQRTLNFTTLPNQFGNTKISVLVKDPKGAITSREINVTVRPVNDAPSFLNGFSDVVANQGDVIPAITLDAVDIDHAKASLTMSVLASSDLGLVPLSGAVLDGNQLRIVPNPARSGVSRLTLQVRDSAGAQTQSSLNVVVRPAVNTPPTLAVIPDLRMNESSSTVVEIVAADAETSIDKIAFEVTSDNSRLFPTSAVELATDKKSLLLKPARFQSGTARLTVTVTDSSLASTSRSFQVVVLPVNDAPQIELFLAEDGKLTIEEDSTVIVGFRANDPDTSFEALTFTASTSSSALFPAESLVVRSGESAQSTRFIALKPALNQVGSAEITLTVSDGLLTRSTSFVATVTPINDPPVVSAVPDFELRQGETSSPIIVSVSDLESAPSTISLTLTTQNESVAPQSGLVAVRSGDSWSISVRASSNVTGFAPIRLDARDSEGAVTQIIFVARVIAQNSPPSITAPASIRLNEDQATVLSSSTVSGNAPVLVFSDDTTPITQLSLEISHTNPTLLPPGSVELVNLPGKPDARQISMRPAPNQFGEAQLVIKVRDQQGLEAQSVSVVSVRPVNDLPALASIPDLRGIEDQALSLPLTVSDAETTIEDLVYSVSSDNSSLFPPASFEVLNQRLIIRPSPDEFGVAQLTLSVRDTDGGVALRNFNVTIAPVNDAPVLTPIANQSIDEGGRLSLFVELEDGDSNLSSVTITPRVSSTSNPNLLTSSSLTVGAPELVRGRQRRLLTLQPTTGQSGVATVTLIADDGELSSSPVSFDFSVRRVNKAPRILPIPPISVTASSVPTVLKVSATDADSGIDLQRTGFAETPGLIIGRPVQNPEDGTLSFTIAADESAKNSNEITLTVVDREGLISQVTALVLVVAQNTPPTVENLTSSIVLQEDQVSEPIPFVVNDRESSTELLSVTALSENPSLIASTGLSIQGNGRERQLVIRPVANAFGTARVSLVVKDVAVLNSAINTLTQFVTVSVLPLNDPPSLQLGSASVIKVSLDGDPATQQVEQSLLVSDLETRPENLQISINSKNATLLPNSPDAIQLVGNGESRFLRLLTSGREAGSFVDVEVTVTDSGALPDGSQPLTRSSTTKSFRIEFVRNQHPPTVAAGGVELIETIEDRPSAPVLLTVTDEDAGGAARVILSGLADRPELISSIEFSGDSTERRMVITPAKDQFGSTRVTVFATDPEGLKSSLSIRLSITPVNDPPALDKVDQLISVQEDSPEQTIVLKGIARGPSNESSGTNLKPLRISVSSQPENGENRGLITIPTVALNPDGTTANLKFTPRPNQTGLLTLQLLLDDGEIVNNLTTQSIKVAVTPLNDPPVIELSNPQFPLYGIEGQTTQPRDLIFSDPDSGQLRAGSIVARSLSPNLLSDGDLIINRPATSSPTISIRTPSGSAGAAEILIVATGSTGLKTELRLGVIISRPPTLRVSSGLSEDGVLRLIQDRTSEVFLVAADQETDVARLRFGVTSITSTTGDSAPISEGGFEFSYLDDGRIRLLVTPNPGALGNAEAFVFVQDLEGGFAQVKVPISVLPPLPEVSIETTPASTLAAGASLRLHAVLSKEGSYDYQWRKDGKNLVGANSRTLNIAKVSDGDGGNYSVIVRNSAGQVSASVPIQVLNPPKISQQPRSQNLTLGSSLVLEVQLEEPANLDGIHFQWRKAGTLLQGQNAPSLIIPSVVAADSGSYDVVVTRIGTLSGVISDPASVEVLVDNLTFADQFEAAVDLPVTSVSPTGLIQQFGNRSGNNLSATRQTQEPLHASKQGGRSVWVKWLAPANGTMKFNTRGSNFDTLLAVYLPQSNPAAVGALELVDSDDDSGGAFTSLVEFNAIRGRTYYVAVDGRLAASGRVKLGWLFQETIVPAPEIVSGAANVSVREGEEVVFSVVTRNVISYQWYVNGSIIAGANQAELRIPSATPKDVGLYEVIVSNGRTQRSSTASLTISTTPGNNISDKSFDQNFLASSPTAQALAIRSRDFKKVSASAASGFRGTQVYNTFGSTTENGEPTICGIVGGASQWSPYVAPSDGVLTVSTEGSDFDTLLGVFTGNPEDGFEGLTLLACDDNGGGGGGRTSLVRLPVKSGTTYFIAVDGAGGATGTVVLNYNLTLPDIAITLPPPIQDRGFIQLTIPGIIGATYAVQSSVNLAAWRTVFTTVANSTVIRFRDPESTSATMRFYRLIKLD